MSNDLKAAIREICQACDKDRGRMMDIVRAVQDKFGCVSGEAMDIIAEEVRTHRVEVEGVVSFYAFLSERPKGKVVIRVCDDVIDKMVGGECIARTFSEELGIKFGETTPDGKITLEHTPCIGMCDQAPAALINDVVVTDLSTDTVRRIVADLKNHMEPKRLVHRLGDGNNAHPLVRSMVQNNIRKAGPLIFSPLNRGEAIHKALSLSPVEVIRAVKTARLRGCGGAGFPTGMKWEFTRAAPGKKRYVICNADEGEPGTFKDRVLLTELSDRIFAGMTIAAYAIGSDEGILYLRGEYAYLRPYLEHKLQERRKDGLLGMRICGSADFNFDIRIQMGAGAYICGEETALISSCEGQRGDPKNRPPFPAQQGYLKCPTVVNNCETLCCVTQILKMGPATFNEFGSEKSSGTKVLSISGDCMSPGIYELPYGTKLSDILKMAGAENAAAVQVGGASGTMVGPSEFHRTICFDDLATGGSIMIFGPERNLLEIAEEFMRFFVEESCGFCTPCRVGNVLLKERLARINSGQGEMADLDYLQSLGESIKMASRCGLGQTSPNPVLTTLKKFRHVYEALVGHPSNGRQPAFDIQKALSDAQTVIGRQSIHFPEEQETLS